MQASNLEFCLQLAKGIARQFGPNCEVVVHDLASNDPETSIVAIENGHVTGRKIGDGPSHVVLEQLGKPRDDTPDELCYLTRTPDGKILKSSSMYIRDSEGKVVAIFCVNFDISALTMVEHAVHDLIDTRETERKEPERITLNVSDLLDDLIRQSDELVGKPVALMTKEDKIKAIHFLNSNGALLITKSGDKIAKHFGISKYTLYSYLDSKLGGN
jgi:predicted transcriptional regulator YheO